MRGGTKVMPPNLFLRKFNGDNNEIYKDVSYIFWNYLAIFPQSLRHFQHTFADVE
jgi:hypothetical protein